MSKKSTHVVLLLQVFCLASGAQAETVPFSLRPIFDIEIGNDASLGPDASSNGSGMGARNVASRRRVAYATYDLSEIASPGMVFSNVSFSNYGHDGGTVNVYGVLEDQEHLVTDGITWNTAPGVMNTPTPALDSDVALDLADVTEILLTFEAPARGTRESRRPARPWPNS